MGDFAASSLKNPVTPMATSSGTDKNFCEDDDSCSICLEPFTSDDPVTVTKCKHEYHFQCILEWSQRSKECPVCLQLLALKDPASQELLEAVEVERNSRSRHRLSTSPVFAHTHHEDFDFEPVPYSVESDIDEHIMQHLTAAALGRAHHFSRRQRHRSAGLDPSQFLVFSASSNGSNLQQSYMTMPVESQSAGNPASPESDSERNMESTDRIDHAPPYVPTSRVNTSPNITDTQQGPLRPRILGSPPLPRSPRRSRPSELLSFSETLKSRLSAASSRYKESISKSTRGFKEKLLARNNSVKELSKEVQREVTAGIAGVARMMERLDPTSKNSGSLSPVFDGAVGTSSVSSKGKNLRNNVITPSLDKAHLETAHATSSKSSIHDSDRLSFVPDREEVAQMQDVLQCRGVQH